MHGAPKVVVAILFASGTALLGACGEDDAPRASGPGGATPAVDAPPFPAETIPAAALLKRLHDRVAKGVGISDESWGRDVGQVALSLWPPAAGAGDAGRTDLHRIHANLAHVAGDVSRQVQKGAEGRAAAIASDPISVQIHDEFLKASGTSVDAYRRWVEGPGAELHRRIEANRQRFFENRPR